MRLVKASSFFISLIGFLFFLSANTLMADDFVSTPNKAIILDFKMGFSVINSSGFNKIVSGLNAGYGTDFGNTKFIKGFQSGLLFGIGKNYFGPELAYEFSERVSSSSIYDISESLNVHAFSLGLRYKRTVLQRKHMILAVTLSAGLLQESISMSFEPPASTVYSTSQMDSVGFYLMPGLDLDIPLSGRVGLTNQLSLRYTRTSSFNYSLADSRHNVGDEVFFADGSSLTLNLTGLKFLLGIYFNWS